MKLTPEQISILIELMKNSAQKGNLANSGLVLENSNVLVTAESWVVSNHDASAHSERMLVTETGKIKGSNFTPGLTMITVVEPCTMCMSACFQSGYTEIYYIIPAKRYVDKIPWMTDSTLVDKNLLASQYSNPIKIIHLSEYEEEFCKVFEDSMNHLIR